MFKKMIVLCFLSLKIFAFQAGYEGVNSIDQAPEEVTEKIIANKPFGYCHLEGVPMKYCANMSLNLTGDVIATYAMEDIRDYVNPFPLQNINYPFTIIRNVLNNYTLGVDNRDYKLPTPGQLRFLLENNFIPNAAGCYWARRDVATEFGSYVPAAWRGVECIDSARLIRIVRDGAPSFCEDRWEACGLRIGKLEIKITLKTVLNSVPIKFKYQYKSGDTILVEEIVLKANTSTTIETNYGGERYNIFAQIPSYGSGGGFSTNHAWGPLDQYAGSCIELIADGVSPYYSMYTYTGPLPC